MSHREVHAVIDTADFAPAYAGEEWVTLTFRVPKNTAACAGIWTLQPKCAGTFPWAEDRTDYATKAAGEG